MKIDGVQLIPFKVTHDPRGSLSELFRSDADGGYPLQQWNCIKSRPRVLRGMHAHLLYEEFYIPLEGRMFFLLKDARRSSPTFGNEQSFLSPDVASASLIVPIGVAHGVYFETAGTLMYGLSAAWGGEHEYAFRWNDSAVKTPWPTTDPLLSERDAEAGSFMDMVGAMESARELVDG
jgi:dTDP-4-dehydrorhamnose 3,5-epimerase